MMRGQRELGLDVAVASVSTSSADLLGETILRAINPVVATYARADAVDVRMSAVAQPAVGRRPARSAHDLLDEIEALVLAAVGEHVWARGSTTWPDAIGAELDNRGWSLATREIGTGGSLITLFGLRPWLIGSESARAARSGDGRLDPGRSAARLRTDLGADVGLVLAVRERGRDTTVSAAVATPTRTIRRRSTVFLGGEQGRLRAALGAAALLLEVLREEA